MRCKTNEVFEVSNVCSCEATQSSSGSFCALNIPLLPKKVRKRVGRSLRWLLLINEVGIARLLSLVAAWLPSFVCVHCLHSDPPTAHPCILYQVTLLNVSKHWPMIFPPALQRWYNKGYRCNFLRFNFFRQMFHLNCNSPENREKTILTTILIYKIPMYTQVEASGAH